VTATRRWDGDQRGEGIADGAWIAGDVRRFVAALAVENWIAEDPDLHLLPHLQRACAVPGAPWTLQRAEMHDSVYVVFLDWLGNPPRQGQLRADVFALLGTFVETVAYIHQRVLDDAICYDIATGLLAEDTQFRPHGHLVQFRITGAAVDAICASRRSSTGS
jgi:hypothetical protein